MIKKKKKVPKQVILRRLKKKGDKYWSLYIRARDGKCLICGSTKSLQAHHALVRKKVSNQTRFHKNNGCTLCYICHLIEIHGNATKTILEKYLEVLNSLYTKEQQEEVVRKSKEKNKLDIPELTIIVEDLIKSLKELKDKPKQ